MGADDVRERLQSAADGLVASGAEAGLQIAVVRDGRLVAEVTAGRAATREGCDLDAGTLFHAASTAKGVASAVAHVLVERGELAYDLRVAEVWPEFGAHGKDGVTLRHILLHTAGVPAPPYDTTVEDLCDWEHMCAALAAAEPWWPPGTRFGYHAQTFGFLLGETVRRATGRSLAWWLREAVTRPLGVEDEVHFGVPEPLLGRVALQEPPPGAPPAGPEPGSPPDRALPPGIRPDAGRANRADVLTTSSYSAGTMTARGVARVYSALLGHVEGVELVSPARRTAMAAVQFEGMDEVMGFPITWAFGFSTYRPGDGPARPGSTFGMVGMNGSAAYADIDSGVAVVVMRNRFDGGLGTLSQVGRIVDDAYPSRGDSG
ncbi:serine hydrolase domain-containing protein [Nonomuraea zeae]|uniref:Beta-lactamase family protein n=1 Tax=Nonomuraea zeae TaxID=1642303 RepID=A0A5S4FYP2_9ACTN|nr:serine hydrolase domain-containing protein [Nonomuraea zeae]TMR25925.1 beta-lactamase family protein [Nonomuraea zeae]